MAGPETRILVASLGTLGDVEPTFLLAARLKEAGFDVLVASSREYAGHAAAAGLPFAMIRPDAGVDDNVLSRACMHPVTGEEALYRQFLLPYLDQSCDDLAPLVRETDFFISGLLIVGAPILAEIYDKPWAQVTTSPFYFGAPALAPDTPAYPWLTDYAARLRAMSEPYDAATAATCRRLGLVRSGPLRRCEMPLCMFPKSFAAQLPDFRGAHLALGFPKGGLHEPLAPEIGAFLATGDAPVVLSLGSAASDFAGVEFYETAVRAARALKLRLILLAGRLGASGLGHLSDGQDVLVAESAPHDALFPHARFIVHHGGLGTLSKALRAGKPSLVVPFAHDQPLNALFLLKQGLASVLGLSEWREERVIEAWAQLDGAHAIRQNCEAFARENADTDGAQVAAFLIEHIIETKAARSGAVGAPG